MTLKNVSKKTIISNGIKFPDGLIDNFLGMILRKNQRGLIFDTRFGIHTFFLNRPIDVLVLDRERVVDLKENLKPYQIFIWNPKYNIVVETPNGSIKKSKTEIGDKIEYK